ncbi:MAG TPA: DnrO protein [Thermomonas sp.]|nr:DnrO protein [Thermomonas sp.]
MAASNCIMGSIIFAGMALSAPLHAQHAHSRPAPVPAAHSTTATRWATDAPLRGGMRGARDVVAALEHGRHGHLDAAQVRLLAARLEGHVQGIFAECRLAPQADAALHDILLPLLDGARALAADPDDLRPLEPMRVALDAYARGFDDPGFRSR